MITWAWMAPEAERRLIRGDPMLPSDWDGGERLWLIDLIAPYRGLAQSVGRWLSVPGNFSDDDFFFRRVTGANKTRRIAQLSVTDRKLVATYSDEDFLSD